MLKKKNVVDTIQTPGVHNHAHVKLARGREEKWIRNGNAKNMTIVSYVTLYFSISFLSSTTIFLKSELKNFRSNFLLQLVIYLGTLSKNNDYTMLRKSYSMQTRLYMEPESQTSVLPFRLLP